MLLKSERLCLHNYLTIKAGLEQEESRESEVQFEIDREETINNVVKNVTEKLPSATADIADYLKRNKQFVDTLCGKSDINKELEKYSASQCPKCKVTVINWPHKTKDSFDLKCKCKGKMLPAS